MTDATYELVKDYFPRGRELGKTPVRGIAGLVRLFTIDTDGNRLLEDNEPKLEALK